MQEQIRDLCHDSSGYELCQRRTIEVAFNFTKESVLLKDIQDQREHLINEFNIAKQVVGEGR
jgi:hypothetical protein